MNYKYFRIKVNDLLLIFCLAGGYLITQKDVFFDRSRASQLIASILAYNDQDIRIDLPPPAIFKVCSNTLSFNKLTIRICNILNLHNFYFF